MCCFCGFEAKARNGLVLHQKAIHKRLGGNGIPSSQNPTRQGDSQDRAATLAVSRASGLTVDDPIASSSGMAPDLSHCPSLPVAPVAPPTGAAAVGGPAGGAQSGVSMRPDAAGGYDAAVRTQLDTLMAMTGVERRGDPSNATLHGSRNGEDLSRNFDFQTLSTRVRAMYEVLDDAARSVPILERRKRSRPGQFNTKRLRALQQFVLGVGGAGLSQREQRLLYSFLDEWDDHRQESPMDATEDFSLRAVFPSPNAFVNALRDDLHEAVLQEGWKKVVVKEGGIEFEVCYRPALEVLLSMMSSSRQVSLWSGNGGPALPTDRRETPMDGDAFRLCEREVIESHGQNAFVLGMHLYSDSSQLSWSGGTFDCRTNGRWAHRLLFSCICAASG